MDSYDALVPAPAYSGRVQLADAWLRDLAGQLDRALVVIASREPLHWETYDPDWASAITVSALDGLPMAARLELLQAGGVSDPAERQLIADASAGLPVLPASGRRHPSADRRQTWPALLSPRTRSSRASSSTWRPRKSARWRY